MAELAYALASGASTARFEGSNPSSSTNFLTKLQVSAVSPAVGGTNWRTRLNVRKDGLSAGKSLLAHILIILFSNLLTFYKLGTHYKMIPRKLYDYKHTF